MKKILVGFTIFFVASILSGFQNIQKVSAKTLDLDYMSGSFMSAYHHLDLRSRGLTKIPNICKDYSGSTLLDIYSIDLGNNQISFINTDLSCLIHLQELNLSYNKIKSIRRLGKLHNLVSLQLQNNQIKKISGLEGLQNLFSLNLSHNQIHSTNGLADLQNLQELQIQYNQISNISDIYKLKNLKILKLEFNQLTSMDRYSIQQIKNIQELSILE